MAKTPSKFSAGASFVVAVTIFVWDHSGKLLPKPILVGGLILLLGGLLFSCSGYVLRSSGAGIAGYIGRFIVVISISATLVLLYGWFLWPEQRSDLRVIGDSELFPFVDN